MAAIFTAQCCVSVLLDVMSPSVTVTYCIQMAKDIIKCFSLLWDEGMDDCLKTHLSPYIPYHHPHPKGGSAS